MAYKKAEDLIEYRRRYYLKNKEKLTAITKLWQISNKEKYLSYMLKSRYNFSLENYNTMLTSQGGVCRICKQPESNIDHWKGEIKRLAVDHCHKTGKV